MSHLKVQFWLSIEAIQQLPNDENLWSLLRFGDAKITTKKKLSEEENWTETKKS